MSRIRSCTYPNISPELCALLSNDDRDLIIVGVIGKSQNEDGIKMAGMDMARFLPDTRAPAIDGQITFYFNENNGKVLYVHFHTPFDLNILDKILRERAKNASSTQEAKSKSKSDVKRLRNATFHSYMRTRFAQILLFAIQVCHIIVLVEPTNVFDTTYLNIFKALRVIREKYVLKFLPKFLKNSNAGALLGKEGRMCSPRFIFFFERYLREYKNIDSLQKLEFEVEDCIYKMLRNEFIITNNSLSSLFSIPRNKRFVCFNTTADLRKSPLTEAVNDLSAYIKSREKAGIGIGSDDGSDTDDDIRPSVGFAKPLKHYRMQINRNEKEQQENRLVSLIQEHVDEAFKTGFDDSMAKFKGKNHFVIPSRKSWYEAFKLLHKIFIENPDNPSFEPNDVDYRSYLENFHKIVDIDDRFQFECCEYGLERALEHYKDMMPPHWSKEFHEQKLYQSISVLLKYGNGTHLAECEQRLRDTCNEYFMSGHQQCEMLSLRGNLCTLQKHDATRAHANGETLISACNCGKTQGRRPDPFTIRQANFEFYQIMASSCVACGKLEKISFPVFEPSINDYRAADLVRSIASANITENASKSPRTDTDADSDYRVLSMASQTPDMKLSLESAITFSDNENHDGDERPLAQVEARDAEEEQEKNDGDENEGAGESCEVVDDEQSMNEIVIQVGAAEDDSKGIFRQASTTEYLSGMVHTLTPTGLLPQFPSWSLVCVGHSSVYAHNSGIPEHVQSGFLSGLNFLLPWDAQVRLENASSWAQTYEKVRHRRKQQPLKEVGDGQTVFMLKIFVGCEYECPRGHRFFMSGPDKISRGGSGISRDGGSKIVFNDMPLYFPCACKNSNNCIAQLMRIHVVTPKAPVNIILDPKIRTGGKNNYTFITGLLEPPKLTQSAYWILRLPFIYEGNDGPIMPPTELTASTSMNYGCLLAGIYGIVETKSD